MTSAKWGGFSLDDRPSRSPSPPPKHGSSPHVSPLHPAGLARSRSALPSPKPLLLGPAAPGLAHLSVRSLQCTSGVHQSAVSAVLAWFERPQARACPTRAQLSVRAQVPVMPIAEPVHVHVHVAMLCMCFVCLCACLCLCDRRKCHVVYVCRVSVCVSVPVHVHVAMSCVCFVCLCVCLCLCDRRKCHVVYVCRVSECVSVPV